MVTLAEVQTEITKQGASWKAGHTNISRAQGGPGPVLFGLNITQADERQLVPANKHALQFKQRPRASAHDWRNHNGKNWVTPIKSQGTTCGSCVAFTVCAAMEAQRRIQTKDADLAIALSEADLFFCGCGDCCVDGWDLVPALTRAEQVGVAAEASFPYVGQNTPCTDPQPKVLHVESWRALQSAEERKQHLCDCGPLVAGMQIYEDLPYYVSGVYRYVTGNLMGLHSVCIIGYDDNAGCWVAKNSWDTGWGEAGFFKIAYGQCGIDDTILSYGLTVR
jgi:C1A family cysteine protease